MFRIFRTLLLLALFNVAHAQDIKVVYHVNTGIDAAATALNNIQNHLNAEPKVKIVVVTHGPGIDFLLQDAGSCSADLFAAAHTRPIFDALVRYVRTPNAPFKAAIASLLIKLLMNPQVFTPRSCPTCGRCFPSRTWF